MVHTKAVKDLFFGTHVMYPLNFFGSEISKKIPRHLHRLAKHNYVQFYFVRQ